MTIRIRRDTATNWTTVNPVLAGGQLGFETDTGKIKVGDGVTAWAGLAYRFEGSTDLGYVASSRLLTSSTGTDVTLPIADTSNAGLAPVRSGVATQYLDGTGAYSVPAGSGGVTDGDKGDITVSGSGTVWTVDAGAITLSKMANLAASTIIGNNTGSPATPIALTASQVKTLLAIVAGDVSGLSQEIYNRSSEGVETVTAAGTTTLTAASVPVQYFSGATTQTVVMPDVTTLTLGRTWQIVTGGSTGTVTVQSSGLNTIATLTSNLTLAVTCIALTGTTDASWAFRLLPRTRTGTGNAVFSFSPTFGGTPIFPAADTSRASLRVPHGTAPTTPTDGDLWTTTAGVFARVNGATVGPFSAGGGSGITDLTGDVTATGPGSVAATIANNAVTFAKMQDIATDTLIGRDTAASGDPEAITVTGGIEFSGAGSIRTSAFTGDVTKTAGGTALTIAANAVTNTQLADMAANTAKVRAAATSGDPSDLAVGTNTVLGRQSGDIVAAQVATGQVADDAITNPKLANVATATIKGRVTAGTGDPEDLTGTQATTLLDVFTTSLKGLAPASGGGTTNFLRADGTWAAPGGGGSITVQDEGINITTALSTLNFVGAGVTVTGGATATVTISGGGGGGLSDGNYGDVTVSGSGTVIRVNPKVKFGLPLAMGRRLQF